jgi:uncharacterized membrane protein YgcG
LRGAELPLEDTMIMLRRIGLMLLLLLAAARPASAAEHILSFVSDVTVERSGDLDVTETIVVDARGEQIRRGIVRDFPTTYRRADGTPVVVGFEVSSVTRDGRSETWTTEKLANGVRIRIGRADTLLTVGMHEYVIKYRTTRQIGYFSDFDELYWNATGTGWTLPIDVAEARISLPGLVPFRQTAFYTGAQGATGKDAAIISEQPGRIVFRTTKPLPAYQGLTVAAAWQKGILDPPRGPGMLDRAGTWIHDTIVASWVFRHLPLVMALIGLPLVLAYYVYAWIKLGGVPRRGTVIPLFAPPEGMSAAATRYVRRMEFDDKTFTAALLELAVNGHLKLVETKKRISIEQCYGGKPVGYAEEVAEKRLFHSDRRIPLTRSSARELGGAIGGLQGALRKAYDNVTFQANTRWAVRGLLACLAVMVAVVAANWSRDGEVFAPTVFALVVAVPLLMLGFTVLMRGWSARGLSWVICMIMGLVLTGLGLRAAHWILFAHQPDWSEVLPSAAAFALSPLAVFAFALFKMPTQAGRKVMDAIEGFRLYLGVAEEDRLQAFYPPKKTPELFEKYLPYAVALDVENAWARRFESVLENATIEPTEQVWYLGDASKRRDPASIAAFVGNQLPQTIAAASTPPGSSGSSSGSSRDSGSSGSSGGGSSGGGGGGGGGSGW